MAKDWNNEGFFSGTTEDYSNYRWYKGEDQNPYIGNEDMPLAASLWDYERDFHFSFLDRCDTSTPLAEAYKQWKEGFIQDYLPGKAPNPYGDTTDWAKVFETGKR